MGAAEVGTASSLKLAMIVDDVPANRMVLQSLLKHEGYEAVTAENGEQAIEQYLVHKPDIIFMDVMMPVMDGYQATTRIKEISKAQFVPVIFLTALNEADAMVRCIESGGDDFLSKPFKQEILRAKIKSMERIRELSRVVEEQRRDIEMRHQMLLKEQAMAQQIYHRAVTDENVASKYIRSMLNSASIFSGDMLLTADCSDGSMYVLLGDFTGHGLTAAVGVLPSAEVFRAMTGKGFGAREILQTINAKLNKLLPTGMFLAAALVSIEAGMKRARIWNAGMPEVLVAGSPASSGVKQRAVSSYLPLGILADVDLELPPVEVELEEGDRILMCSDGLSEAVNAVGEAYGMDRYEQAALSGADGFEHVISDFKSFCGSQPYRDDVSYVEIKCMPGLLKGKSVD